MNIILSDLTSSDYFNIVTFSHEIDHWKDESQPVDAESLRAARQFVDQITVRGGEHHLIVNKPCINFAEIQIFCAYNNKKELKL